MFSLTREIQKFKEAKKNAIDKNINNWIETKKKAFTEMSKSAKESDKIISEKSLQLIKEKFDAKKEYSKSESTTLKNAIKNVAVAHRAKILMQEELVVKEKQLQELNSKIETLEVDTKKHKKQELKIKVTKGRIKDLKDLINANALSKKLYLKDEPPLGPMGWLKLMTSYLLIMFWALIVIWPVYELVKATFNGYDARSIANTEFQFSLDNFKYLFNHTDYTKWLTNTIVIAAITSVLTVATTLLISYAYSRFRFKGKKSSLLSIMLLQMVPSFAALTVFFLMYTILREKFNMSPRVVLIIIYVGGGLAGNTFIMKGYMDSISTEIDEAAKIDGLSRFQIFLRIILPLTKPMIAIIGLWSFIGPFGDILLPTLLLDDSKDYTIAAGLRRLVANKRDLHQPAYAAGAVIVALPISILFIGLRKFLVGGLVKGGVKG